MKNKLKVLSQKRREKKLIKAENRDRMPRITNETVASHREDVLSGARKYIYPLQHSKHRVVIVTTSLFITAVLGFTTYFVVALYKVQSTSSFIYRVTQVLPFPVARTGSSFVSYESYLFELRHYTHYYETKLKRDFKADSGNKQQLDDYKKRSLDKVINDALIKQIAEEKNITVSDKEIDDQIQLSRDQNRLGGSKRVFEDVIKEYYTWSINDFRRVLRSQLLEEKVNAALDTDAKVKVDGAIAAINGGMTFADAAKQYSDDDSKVAGGEFGVVDRSNTALSAQTVDVLFSLKAGDVSQPIIIGYGTGYALEIIKSLENSGDKAKGAHIVIALKDINTFLNDKKEKQPAKRYIKL